MKNPTLYSTVIYATRPMIDMPTSLLSNIKKNINRALQDEVGFSGLDPLMVEGMKAAWRGELVEIERELINRN